MIVLVIFGECVGLLKGFFFVVMGSVCVIGGVLIGFKIVCKLIFMGFMEIGVLFYE